MTSSLLSRLINIRNRTLRFFRNKPKDYLKTDKNPEVRKSLHTTAFVVVTSVLDKFIYQVSNTCKSLSLTCQP